jgi:RNA polymerase sigma-70 factor (ECF subfamily)
MEEWQLIEGCKRHDRKSQQAVYEQFGRVMYGVCLRYSSDAESAQDLLHDGFVKIFTNIKTFEGKGSFVGWMTRVFVNLALENIRKNKLKKQNVEDIENLSEDIVDDAGDELSELTEKDLLQMIQELPQGYRSVFNLYALENYSHKEIGEMLGIAEVTSRSQYIRARQLLQTKVKEFLKKYEIG